MTRIRQATGGDEAFVVSLVPRFVEHGAADGHAPQTVIDGTSRVLREALRSPDHDELFLIAEDETGKATGFIYAVTHRDFFTHERYVHVSEIAVAESGRGVGAVLMQAAEDWSRKRGCRVISLNVVDENVAGRRFYERRGYVVGHYHYVKRLDSPSG